MSDDPVLIFKNMSNVLFQRERATVKIGGSWFSRHLQGAIQGFCFSVFPSFQTNKGLSPCSGPDTLLGSVWVEWEHVPQVVQLVEVR